MKIRAAFPQVVLLFSSLASNARTEMGKHQDREEIVTVSRNTDVSVLQLVVFQKWKAREKRGNIAVSRNNDVSVLRLVVCIYVC
jgi:hypothetical protein